MEGWRWYTDKDIWEDNWISGSHNFKIQTTRGNNLVLTVDEIINPVNSTWDVDLVKAIFWPTDVYRILQIPITSDREDVVAWDYNRSGLFSVRSAYHCQWESKFGPRCNRVQADTASRTKLWKNLWKLNLPGKIKILGWQALKGLLPCQAILANRHVGKEDAQFVRMEQKTSST